MPNTDDRYIPTLQASTTGQPTVSLTNAQEELRKIWEVVHSLEGRLGTIALRDSVTVAGDLTATGDISAGGSVTLGDSLTITERPFINSSRTPDLSASGSVNFFFDRVTDRLRSSENARAYQDVLMYEGTRVTRAAAQTIPDDTETAISWDTQIFDTADVWSLASPTAIVFPYTGIYLLGAQIAWAANTTGYRSLRLVLNGGDAIAVDTVDAPATLGTAQSVVTLWQVAATSDFIEAVVRQNSGGNLDAEVNAQYSPIIWAIRLI